MPLDVQRLLTQFQGKNYELHESHINPQYVKVLRTIGFDRCYTRAVGPYLWDIAGTKYLDFISGYGVFTLGRNHPQVRQALIDFMAADYPSLVQLDAPLLPGLLAEELKRRMPNELERVHFVSSGTEGIEAAIKFAHCATGKPALLYCDKAFHGLTNGSLSINGDATFRQGFAPFLPDCRAIAFNDLEALERTLARGDVAAFFVEPIQGKGVILPAPGYLKEAARLCRRHGALLVADEVQTGLGRTGKFLAIEHEGDVDPDLVVVAKSLSGGYVPVGAVLMRRWIYERVFSSLERAVVHGSTFAKNNLAMIAGLATLAVLDEEDLIARAERMGRLLAVGLEAMRARFEFIKEIRHRGLMVGIEFGEPRSLGGRAAWALMHKMDKSLFPQAVTMPLLDEHHILAQAAGHHIDVIKLLPPLVIHESDVRWFLEAFEKVMMSLEKFPGPAWDVLVRIGKMSMTSRSRQAEQPAL
ncbi:MAG TPA: aspartate aminotransferase family protein [Burkholderiales bacterium]|nr:aspartate aminotransferase family protein [Burkholderiales bacterium]